MITSKRSIIRFDRDIQAFSTKLQLDLGITTRKIAVELFTSIVRKTPVLSGRARGSWNINAGKPNLDVEPEGESTRNSGTGDIATGLKGADAFSKIFITNNLPYIESLENGTSKKAPKGMVRLSLIEVQTFLDRVLRG